ncbi:hypothetical protein CHUAL_004095 [Chamberlinius hualienensis]
MNRIIRVACGLSGGVDSSVAAMILKNKGYDVVGVFMRNWKPVGDEGLEGVCPSSGDFEDAQRVARKLDIKLVEVDFEKEYWNFVFSEFLNDYEEGLTPNPDILCNQFIKFGYFFNYCTERLDAAAIATGHYAKTNFGYDLDNATLKPKLLKSVDRAKDQTFFLSKIPQTALRKTLFPLGDMTKVNVRKLATEGGLNNVASKPDSTGICFIGPRKFRHFIDQYIEPKPGVFVDIDSGLVVGKHQGIHHFTLGQRCNIGGLPQAHYIAYKHVPTQTIYVAAGHEHPALYSSGVITHEPTWINDEPKELHTGELYGYFKYQQTEEAVPCVITMTDKVSNRLKIMFTNGPSRALTPGQYGVIYVGEECLGNARIKIPLSMYPLVGQMYSETVNVNSLQIHKKISS